MDYLYYKAHKEIFSPSCCLLGLWRINADKNYKRNQKAHENLYTQKKLQINADDSGHILVALRTLEGEGQLTLNQNQTYSLKKGNLIFFRLCQQRTYQSLCNNWSFLWCEFLINYNFFDLNTIYSLETLPEENQFFETALTEMHDDNSLDTYLSSRFATQLTLWKKHATKAFSSDHASNKESIDEILSYISVNYPDRDLSITRLAAMANLSERRFRAVFTELVGQSPKKYLTNYRMKIACNLLLNATPPRQYRIFRL